MRIGFTGAQGTGKTSVAKALVKRFPDYLFVPSSARAARKAGFHINRDADPLSQLITTAARVADENKMARFAGNTVSDRTPLDSLAYTRFQSKYVWEDMEPEHRDFYMKVSEDFVIGHMGLYDVVYYFPVIWEPRVDEMRDGDSIYQRAIDEEIKWLLGEFNIKYAVMPNGSVDDRVDFIAGKRSTGQWHRKSLDK